MKMEGEEQVKGLYNFYYVSCTVCSDLQLCLLQISVCPFPFLSSLTSPFPPSLLTKMEGSTNIFKKGPDGKIQAL